MPLNFKAPASSALINASFVYKDADDDKKGRLGLFKTNVNDADAINDVQDYINLLGSLLGLANENDTTGTDYATNNVITDGENRKQALEAVDVALGLLNSLVLNGIIRLRQYSSDSAYESAHGTPVGGEIYYNTTDGKARIFDAVEDEWKPVGSTSSIGNQERLGVGNGTNTTFTLTLLPTNAKGIAVYSNGVLVEDSDYTIADGESEIVFSTAPALGQIIYAYYMTEGEPATGNVPGIRPKTERITLTASDVTNGYIELTQNPESNENLLVRQQNGAFQKPSVDYTLTNNNRVEFSGLDPDMVFIENAEFVISYFY